MLCIDIYFQNDTLRRIADDDLKYQIKDDSKKEIIIRNVFRRNNSFSNIRIKASQYQVVPIRLEDYLIFNFSYNIYEYLGTYEDSRIYVIGFHAIKSDLIREKAPFVGKIYIKKEDLSIARIEMRYHEDYLQHKILNHKFKKDDEVRIKTIHSSTILNFTKDKNDKTVLLSKINIVIDNRTYTTDNRTDQHVSYAQLFVQDVLEKTHYKKADILDDKISIYDLKNKNTSIQETDNLPYETLMLNLDSVDETKKLINSIYENITERNY